MEIIKIPLEQIHMDEDFNCRGRIAAPDVVDLVQDIEKHGLLQPVTVQENPEGSESGDSHVLRGGCWRFGRGLCISSQRRTCNSDHRNNYIGFRVSCSLGR